MGSEARLGGVAVVAVGLHVSEQTGKAGRRPGGAGTSAPAAKPPPAASAIVAAARNRVRVFRSVRRTPLAAAVVIDGDATQDLRSRHR